MTVLQNKKLIIGIVAGAIALIIIGEIIVKSRKQKTDVPPLNPTSPRTNVKSISSVIEAIQKVANKDSGSLDYSVDRFIWHTPQELTSALQSANLKQTDIDSLVYVFGEINDGYNITNSDINFLNSIADKANLN